MLTVFGFGNDGINPNGLIQASDGNFYGTMIDDYGAVFKITPQGQEIILYGFGFGNDEINPNALMQGMDGNFYRTTYYG